MIWLLSCIAGGSAPLPPTVQDRFGDWPFLTLIDAPATVAMTAGGEIPANPQACGACHPDVYREWSAATHAAAATDLQYLAELSKDSSPRWLCLNCHVPTVPQRPTLITPDTRLVRGDDIREIESTPNPHYDPARTADAIGCPTCHVRRDEDGAGVVVGPRADHSSPHRVRVDKQSLNDVCLRCHSPGPAVITPQFFCWFETADEVAAGPSAGTSCVDCHMPLVERPVAVGGVVRQTRSHQWVGGGVPKRVSDYDGLVARGWAPGFELEPVVEASSFIVRIRNTSGHSLPTADPERHLRVEVRGFAGDKVTWSQVRRVGQRWDWGEASTGRPAKRLVDERIGPGETLEWVLPMPADAERFQVEVLHVRMSTEAADYARTAQLDTELQVLNPNAVTQLPKLDEFYPLATVVADVSLDRAGAVTRRATLDELVAASKALAAAPMAEKRARIHVD